MTAHTRSETIAPADLKEEYDPSIFKKYQKVDDVIEDANKKFGENNLSVEYFNHIASLIRKRFYHGYSYYSFKDNFLAYSAGLVWNHLSAVVIPDDILKYPMAACSQQAIVMMAIFKKRSIQYRKVHFSNHYTLEAFIDGKWKFFDTNKEPDIMDQRESLEEMIADARFETAYLKRDVSPETIADWKINFSYGAIDEDPAPQAKLFHQAGFWLQSNFLTIMSVLTLLSVFLFVRKKDQKIS
jgi:hypothetical protein